MSDNMQDTMCRHCCKWTHQLTRNGAGLLFCDQYCAYRYDLRYGTKYAFERYHFIPYGNSVRFPTADVDVAWAALKDWLTHNWQRPTLEEIRREYKIVPSDELHPQWTTFKKGFWHDCV